MRIKHGANANSATFKLSPFSLCQPFLSLKSRSEHHHQWPTIAGGGYPMEIRTDSSADAAGGSTTLQQPQLPPGFRFHPTDEELVVHYLKRKAQSAPLPVSIIADVDLYKFDPWELPAKAVFGEQEWYFFSPRDRKYPNGARPNRAATSGYWKATGTDKPVLTAGGSQKVGVKKALVFYGGKPPRGAKTNWIMHEYRLADNKSINKPPGCDPTHKKGSLRLDDWVLCRIYKKNNNTNRGMDHHHHDHHQHHHHHHHEDGDQDSMHDILGSLPCTLSIGQQQQLHPQNYGAALLDSSYHPHHPIFHAGIMDGSDHPTSNTLKRAHPSLYWSVDVTAAPVTVGPPSGKRSTVDDGEDSGSAALLSHLPAQTPPLIGVDGAFRQPYHVPGINWYS